LILAQKPYFQVPNMPLTQSVYAQAAIKSGVIPALGGTASRQHLPKKEQRLLLEVQPLCPTLSCLSVRSVLMKAGAILGFPASGCFIRKLPVA